MIPAKNTDEIEVQSTIQGEDIAMSIAPESMDHIMDAMINLYEDTEGAPLREVATNAYDAHIAAGNTAPIEITLPSPLASFLTVRDYGIGLNADDIRNIYSKYGVSTKRETDEQVGMLGFGCKSPLAYTSQFTLVGVKDGIQTTVNIGRDEDDGGTMTIIDESPTDEPNGVTVTIPAKRSNTFAQKAKDLFKYWPAGSVLVNGEEPQKLTGLMVTDEIMIIESGYYEDDMIVMGNVAYPVGHETLSEGMGSDYNVVAFVPIGSVTPVPSREGLKDNRMKRDAIDAIKLVLKDHIAGAVQRNVDEANSTREAFQIAAKFRRMVGKKTTLTYNGVEVPSSFKVTGEDDPRFVITHMYSSPISRASRERSIPASYFVEDATLFVHGYDRPTFTPTQKKKLIKYAEDNGHSTVETFILHEDETKIDPQWINNDLIVDWSEINEIKLPRKTHSGVVSYKSIPASYEAYVEGEYVEELAADDIDTTDLYYVNTSTVDNPKLIARLLAKHRPSSTIVVMSSNRIDKFTRVFSMALPATQELRDFYEVELLTKVTDEDRFVEAANDGWRSGYNCKALDADKIDDPELARFVRANGKKQSAHMEAIESFLKHRHVLGIHSPFSGDDEIKDPFDNYPLFDYNANQDHLTFYVNAVYAARKDS